MNQWYIIYMGGMGREPEVHGPFRTKAEAVAYFDWPGTKKYGSLYHHPTRSGYIGKKKDFLDEGFEWAFPE